ncbi:MFS transporter [Rathayibacter rathayi]|uniref:MFS transporter n=1 Tax=Rathayibacter rathayi TaxID=33887 RepID=UPI000CE8E093|nr:MFS transporter [Rathayibacter rathayi]PPF22296.1 MFS transporter [Rathayibacter rathayi]PPG91038.1 MFS transporter [Rathayibacter rathayi]
MGGFGIGSTEFVAMGLLPQLAADLLPDVYAASQEQAVSQAGMLISAYALGVVVGAPTIAAAAARWPRKRLLLILLVAFTVGTIGSALLPSFPLVLAARFVAALPHGAYFGIASLVAADLMGPGNRGKGVAFVLSGLTIANVLGVPAITWVGQAAGWRSAYLVVAALFALTVVAVQLLVPAQPGNPAATVRNELRAFGRLQVWMTLLVGAIGFGGLFAMYSYISPLATEVTGLPLGAVPWILVVIGLGMTVGNLVGGWAADRDVRRALVVFYAGVGVSLIGLALSASSVVGLVVFAFLAAGFSAAASPAIQTRLMDVARDSQTIAAALNHSALNIGNSIGAALGGLTIAVGLGYLSSIWVGVGLTAAGIALALTSIAIDRVRGTVYPVHREAPAPSTDGMPVDAL